MPSRFYAQMDGRGQSPSPTIFCTMFCQVWRYISGESTSDMKVIIS